MDTFIPDLKFYLDANVLVDIIEGDNGERCLELRDALIAASECFGVIVLTSPLAKWEALSVRQREKWAEEMVKKHDCHYRHASQPDRIRNLASRAQPADLQGIAHEILEEAAEALGTLSDDLIAPRRADLTSERDYSTFVDNLVAESGVDLNDAIIIADALFDQCSVFVTRDSSLRSEAGRSRELQSVWDTVSDRMELPGQFQITDPATLLDKTINTTCVELLSEINSPLLLGTVANFFTDKRVALVCATKVEVGERDVVYFVDTAGVTEQTVDSIHVNRDPVDRASRGVDVCIRTDNKIARGSKVFLSSY